MSRLKDLRKYVDAELDRMPDPEKRISAAAHLYGVSLAATMLAKKRGLDPELASMAGMLHDLHAYRTGSYDDHAHKGAELARQILEELKLTEAGETDLICSAIYHHDDKIRGGCSDGRAPEGRGCDPPLPERRGEAGEGERTEAVRQYLRRVRTDEKAGLKIISALLL